MCLFVPNYSKILSIVFTVILARYYVTLNISIKKKKREKKKGGEFGEKGFSLYNT